MKTPMTYYGGKQKVASWIIQFFPKHKTYIEPFAGGLAVFFAKLKSPKIKEIINDNNSNIYNFYKQLRDNNEELSRVLENTCFSREDFNNCANIFSGNIPANDLERARATFISTQQAFASTPQKGFGHAGLSNHSSFRNKTLSIKHFKKRMSGVVIENKDAIEVIRENDSSDSFFYLDPPYPGTDMGHYRGYSIDDFNKLLKILKNIKGKFALSFYLVTKMEFWGELRILEKRKMTLTNEEGPRLERLAMNY